MSSLAIKASYTSKEIIDVFNNEVDLILRKIGVPLSAKSIEKWLNNFEVEDRIGALEILQKLYFVQQLEQFELAEMIVSDCSRYQRSIYFDEKQANS